MPLWMAENSPAHGTLYFPNRIIFCVYTSKKGSLPSHTSHNMLVYQTCFFFFLNKAKPEKALFLLQQTTRAIQQIHKQ